MLQLLSLPKHSTMARPKKEDTIQPTIQEQPQPQKVKPVIVETRAMPVIRAVQPAADKGNMAWLLYIPTGNRLRVTRKHAEKMAKGNKNYKVL